MPDTGFAVPRADEVAGLLRENAKLRRINAALVAAVERGPDVAGSAFALFQTAAALGNQVQERTAALTTAMAELTRAKEDEAQAKQRLEAAIEAINQGIVLCDAEDRIVVSNGRYRELWGGLPAEPGTPFAEIVHGAATLCAASCGYADPADWAAFRLARHRDPGEPFVIQFADGTWLQVSERRVPGGGTVCLYTDITAVKRDEAARTDALMRANAEITAAKADAEAVNASKTKFFAAANHDLLQPLAAARVFASALSERRLSPPNRELVRHALSALDSVDDMITALLDIAKLDAGIMPPAPCSFAIREVMERVGAEYGLIAARRRLRLRVFAGDAVVQSDPRLLARIFRNLVSNALRYTSSGGVLIGHRRVPGGLLVGVWDTGVGIAPDQLDAIFEEFHRLPQTHDRGERGAGLGLSIVRRISRMLDHRMVVRSVPGRGSAFGIVVPLSDAPAVNLQPARTQSGGGPQGLRGRCVQLIDDEPHVLHGLGVLLGGWGMRVRGAACAAQALEAAAADGPDGGAPDLIIADYRLAGGVTGLDAIATLRRRWGELPAIVVTADHGGEAQAAVTEAGLHLLHKPVRPARLRSLITHVLQHGAVEA
jgi:signal transduction histidine kinase/CheY-like chemotaxis protein